MSKIASDTPSQENGGILELWGQREEKLCHYKSLLWRGTSSENTYPEDHNGAQAREASRPHAILMLIALGSSPEAALGMPEDPAHWIE